MNFRAFLLNSAMWSCPYIENYRSISMKYTGVCVIPFIPYSETQTNTLVYGDFYLDKLNKLL